MHIAYTTSPGRGETDQLLYSFAEALLKQGRRPVGTVQINTDCGGPGLCDMDVKVLPDGPVIRISQSLGAGAKGCRLDPSALETSVGIAEQGLEADADCLIINKFGKHEASGAGFRPVIAKALEKGIPVIVGVGRLNQEAFAEFTGGMATGLTPDVASLMRWFENCARAGQAA